MTEETHDCPENIQEILTKAGGTNWYGEPNFRAVWSRARLSWIGGWWTDLKDDGEILREIFEMRRVPKYLPPWDRWVIETYRPAEWYGSRWCWEFQTKEYAFPEHQAASPSLQSLGPYPERGDYEFLRILDEPCAECWRKIHAEPNQDAKLMIVNGCTDRVFLQLTSRAAKLFAQMIMRSREAREAEQARAIREQHAREIAILDQRSAARFEATENVELSKAQKEKIERVSGPAMDRLLANAMKRRMEMPPQFRHLARSRAFAIN